MNCLWFVQWRKSSQQMTQTWPAMLVVGSPNSSPGPTLSTDLQQLQVPGQEYPICIYLLKKDIYSAHTYVASTWLHWRIWLYISFIVGGFTVDVYAFKRSIDYSIPCPVMREADNNGKKTQIFPLTEETSVLCIWNVPCFPKSICITRKC
jgi:hypothetical protein